MIVISLNMDQLGRCVLTIDHHAEPVTTAAWAPDGESFVTASLDKQTQLCLWSVSGRPMYSWATDYRVQYCAISSDGQRLVTISIERQIFVYNFVTREEQHSFLLKFDMTSLSISRDSRYMLINTTANEVHLIDIETADIVRKFVGHKQGKFVIRSAFGGADENLIVSGSEGK
jgi:WD repeat-containing protein 26